MVFFLIDAAGIQHKKYTGAFQLNHAIYVSFQIDLRQFCTQMFDPFS